MLLVVDLHAPRQRQRRRALQRRRRLLLLNAIASLLQRKFGAVREIIRRLRLQELQCLMLAPCQPNTNTTINRSG